MIKNGASAPIPGIQKLDRCKIAREPEFDRQHPTRNQMKPTAMILRLIAVFFMLSTAHGQASDQNLPVIDGKETVATVNDEPITLEELTRAISAAHAARSREIEAAEGKAGRISYGGILQRLINTRLIVLEATNMGIGELPEVKEVLDHYARQSSMELLLEHHVKEIKADQAEVEKLYKSFVKEWEIKSVHSEKKGELEKIEEQVKAGRNFDALVEQAVVNGAVTADNEARFLKDRDLTPAVAGLVSKMEVGGISPVVPVGQKGFLIFTLKGVRFPESEDPALRQQAEREVLNRNKVQAAKDYYQELENKYVTVNEKFLNALDFEANEPGFEKLLQDQRVIATVRGEEPVTVADMAGSLKKKFFHGIDKAVQAKRLNKRKKAILDEILEKRVLIKEALKQGIDKTDEYVYRIKEYENSVIFGTFVNKVVAPEIKLDLADLQAYYTENSAQYTSPQMLRIKTIVFRKRSTALAAANKLQTGTDFDWLRANADDQVDPNAEGIFKFDGRLITLNSLPEDIQKAVAGTKTGDFKLYSGPQGHFYVLYILQSIDPQTQPFEAVRKDVSKKVYNDKLKQSLERWTSQLQEYYPVKIYQAEPE